MPGFGRNLLVRAAKHPQKRFCLNFDGYLLKIVSGRVLCFWNQLGALPEDDVYRRDVLFDSVNTRTGMVLLYMGLQANGYDLVLHPDQPQLHRRDCAGIMQLKRQ